MATLDIDIHYDNLSEWLQTRRKIYATWSKDHKVLRARVNAAAKVMPNAQDVREVTQDGDLTFLKCQRILTMLEKRAKKAGTDGKSFFGSYTDEHLREWSAIINEYTKTNLHLAEASRLMTQATDFEIPDLKNNLAAFKKQLQDQQKRELDAMKAVESERKALSAACDAIGIAGRSYRKELSALASDLPTLIFELESAVRSDPVLDSLTYYRAFLGFTAEQSGFPVTLRVTALFELANAALPDAPSGDDGSAVEGDKAVEADWGITVEGDGEGDGGDDAAGGVDWGISVEGEGAGAGAGGGDIDWGFTVEASGEDAPATEGTTDADSPSYPLKAAEMQEVILNDLLELEAFLRQRHAEASTGAMSMFDQMSNLPVPLRGFDGPKLQRLLSGVSSTIALFQSDRLHQLTQIQCSPRYLDRLEATFTRRDRQLGKLQARVKDSQQRQTELIDSISKTEPLVKEKIGELKKVKLMVESEVSKLFGGTKVHIMGAINTL